MRALYTQWRAGNGLTPLLLLIAPIPEAIFLDRVIEVRLTL